MSCDFGIWDRPRTLSPNRANRIYRQLIREDLSCVKPSIKINQFLEDLSNLYPDEDVENSPWSCPHEFSSGHVLLSCVISRSSETRKTILTLSKNMDFYATTPN
jgi:hypothetical protein